MGALQDFLRERAREAGIPPEFHDFWERLYLEGRPLPEVAAELGMDLQVATEMEAEFVRYLRDLGRTSQ